MAQAPAHPALDESSLRTLVDGVPAFLFATTPSGELEWANRPLLDYLHRSLDELRGWQLTAAIHPDDLPLTMATSQSGVMSGRAYTVQHRLLGADGIYRWFQFRAQPAFDDSGRICRWYGTVADIDDVRRVQDALRASERALRLFIDSIPGLVYTMTPGCELEFVNQKLLEYFGHPLEVLRDWDKIGCVHPDDMPRVRASLQRTIELGVPHEVEQRLRRADGVYRWFQPRGYAFRDAQGRILRWYCLLTDVEELKQTEADLRALQARFARAEHSAALSELAASIAQAINQPLAAVAAGAEACRRWLSSNPPNVERGLRSAERLLEDSSHAADAVARVRALFRGGPSTRQTVDVNGVVEHVRLLLHDDLRDRRVTLRVELAPMRPLVHADAVHMHQLIANIVRNAIEAVDALPEERRQVALSTSVAGEEVRIEIRDLGTGIPDRNAIFDPFYTTKADALGMGLAICRSIVEAHGGQLWADNHEPHGAVFTVVLRRASADSPTDEASIAKLSTDRDGDAPRS